MISVVVSTMKGLVSLLSGEDDILDEDDGEEDGDEDIDDDNDDDDMDDDIGDVRGGSGDDDESDGSHTQSESNSESKRARGDSQDSHRIDDEVASMVETMMSLGLGFPRDVCEVALRHCNYDVETAIHFCLEHGNDMGALVYASGAGADLASRRRDVVLDKLLEMGFPETWCRKALDATDGIF